MEVTAHQHGQQTQFLQVLGKALFLHQEALKRRLSIYIGIWINLEQLDGLKHPSGRIPKITSCLDNPCFFQDFSFVLQKLQYQAFLRVSDNGCHQP